ncbi:unnamed protein product [Ambrosiozyma monospora]|uniref:Unnamed protein product n=1 Tax=Ambrosiozyma monospora TaxID=43982 RepID=A0ACB5TDL9_AMBMO|nr:unnamed protein product [Ambrosiozyma monospora]
MHTWVALDWCCNRFLEDGDTLVVIASINPTSKSSLVKKMSNDVFQHNSKLITDEAVRRSPEYTKVACENIMKYILSILNPHKIVKVTIELGVGSTKDVLKDMYGLYMPSVVVTAAKPSLAPSTKSWLTSRITDRLVKNFRVPVIIAPAKNMNVFEKRLFKSLNKRYELLGRDDYLEEDEEQILDEIDQVGKYHLEEQLADLKSKAFGPKMLKKLEQLELDDSSATPLDNKPSIPPPSTNSDNATGASSSILNNGAAEDDLNDEDYDSEASEDSEYSAEIQTFDPSEDLSNLSSSDDDEETYENDAPKLLKKMEFSTQINVYKELTDLKNKGINQDTFKDWLSLVSKEAYTLGIKLAEQAKSGGERAKLVRTMTGAPDGSYGRQKSMLLDDAPATPPSAPAGRKSMLFDGGVNSAYGNASAKPRNSSLKFTEQTHPKYAASGSVSGTPKIQVSRPPLAQPQVKRNHTAPSGSLPLVTKEDLAKANANANAKANSNNHGHANGEELKKKKSISLNSSPRGSFSGGSSSGMGMGSLFGGHHHGGGSGLGKARSSSQLRPSVSNSSEKKNGGSGGGGGAGGLFKKFWGKK